MPTGKPARKSSAQLRVVQAPLPSARAHGSADAAALDPVSGDRYEILFNYASDAILTVAANGVIDKMNQAAEELTGFLRSEIEGKPLSQVIPDPKQHRIPDRARPITPEILTLPGTYEDIAILRKDGYVRLVEVSVRVVVRTGETPEGEAGKISIALFRDVTEKKQMERELITKHAELRNAYFQLEKKNAEAQAMQDQLISAGKMAALGELAAGIAHELNQPLQGIRGYGQELQTLLDAGAAGKAAFEVKDALKEVISNVDKMASIIDYLRTFVRKSTENHEWTNVHDAIEEALKMLNRQLATRGIKVERVFSPDLPKVYANPLQLEQVFINMVTNARDAIEATKRGSGKIIIRTHLSGGFVEVDFQDDGVGMTSATKTKAFNPFFTTKEVGKGMGLGLSLSYGLISKLHGSIVVESELGRGALFHIRFPKDFREN